MALEPIVLLQINKGLVVLEHLVLEHLKVYDYFWARIAELQRIWEKVYDNLHQSSLVSINMLIEWGFLRGDILDQQLNTFLWGHMGDNTKCLADKFRERKVFLVQFKSTVFKLGQIQ
jgi:hypothetical protein